MAFIIFSHHDDLINSLKEFKILLEKSFMNGGKPNIHFLTPKI